MTWELFWQFAGRYGIGVAGLLALLYASYAGWFHWRREVLATEKDWETERTDLLRQMADQRRDFDQRLLEVITDRNYYRDTTMDLLQRYDREVSTSEAAVRTATRAISRRS